MPGAFLLLAATCSDTYLLWHLARLKLYSRSVREIYCTIFHKDLRSQIAMRMVKIGQNLATLVPLKKKLEGNFRVFGPKIWPCQNFLALFQRFHLGPQLRIIQINGWNSDLLELNAERKPKCKTGSFCNFPCSFFMRGPIMAILLCYMKMLKPS